MQRYEAKSEVTGLVWKVLKTVGETVTEGDTLMILESMKIEIPVASEKEGTVVDVRVAEGLPVTEGETLMVIEY